MSTNCDPKVMTQKLADVKDNIFGVVTGLHQEAVSSYNSTRRGVNGVLVEVSRCLKEAFDRETRGLQKSVCAAVRGIAEGTRGSFTKALIVIDKRLGVIAAEPLQEVRLLNQRLFCRTLQVGAHKWVY